jgi:DHA3 family macrolide efflux protein-like MFS transporter
MGPFIILWAGQAVSLIGSQAVQFALIWWLTARTGSGTVLATAALLALLPRVLLGPFIGALVDRWNRKRIMLIADATAALAAVLVALLFAFGTASVSQVLILLFLRALAGAFHEPAMLASTTLMVPQEHLARVQGLNQALQGGQLILAPPLGALLNAVLPMEGVVAVDPITALFAIVPLLFIRVPQPERAAERSGAGIGSTWRDVGEGLRYLGSRSGHMALLGMACVINLLMVPAFSLLPLLVIEQRGGPAQFGWMTSVFGIATIAGGILLALWGGFRRRVHTSLTALLGTGLATLLLGTAPTWEVGMVAAAAVGISIPMVNGPVQAVLQATVAPEIQGRVFTLYASVATIAAPVGLLLAAPVADLAGVRAWYAAGGLACVLLGSIGFLSPAIASIERDR